MISPFKIPVVMQAAYFAKENFQKMYAGKSGLDVRSVTIGRMQNAEEWRRKIFIYAICASKPKYIDMQMLTSFGSFVVL
ncbi:unnamed protein product [Acanthoscelides obtectus]|uniref:Uncharacterized protein n=1 Tax=Acanthoscelides obtectus TaxID=200917 RepID=A0A9P0KSJ6_ACAOB|nr:unnamed protein product [Acanthoscelides obtectus]CAK1641897.1 hypothetical protein AOBTE_LOCUS12705 [Acanthoscelides obtectus]